MITGKVIKEIYKKFHKPARREEDLHLPYFTKLLEPNHKISSRGEELIIESLEEFNPFRRVLKRRLHGILEFDHNVALVTPSHILFLSKGSPEVRVSMRPESNSLLSRIFG